MLNCDQFQWLAGADPQRLSWAQKLHWLSCRGCARYLRKMRALDRRIRRALDVTLPGTAGTLARVGAASNQARQPLR